MADIKSTPELTETEGELFRKIAEGVKGFGIFVTDPDGNIVTWNEGAERIRGYSASEIIGQNISIFYTPEDIKTGQQKRKLEEAKIHGRYEDEDWYVRKDGSRFWANVAITALVDQDCHLFGFSMVTQDLTERKRAEDVLKRAYEELGKLVQEKTQERSHWEDLFDHTGWGVAVINHEENTFRTINPAFAQMHGYLPTELVGKSVSLVSLPDSKNEEDRYLQLAISEKRDVTYEATHIRKDGRRFPVLADIIVIRAPEGKILYRAINIQDITERKQAEESLRKSEQDFRLLAEAIPQIVWTSDPSGRVSYFNRRWYEFASEQFAHSWDPAVHPDDLERVREHWNDVVQAGTPYEIEYRLKRAHDSTYRWHLARATAVRGANGEIIKWFGTFTDIDEQKKMIQERDHALREAQEAIQSRDEFLSIASHELKTPLTSIRLQLQMLSQQTHESLANHSLTTGSTKNGQFTPEILAQGVDLCEKQSKRLSDLLEQLLDLTRIRLGLLELSPERIELEPLVRQVALRVQAEIEPKNVPISIKVQGACSGLWDPARIEQVVSNLIENAIKYGEKKPVSVIIEPGKDLSSARLIVKDQGPGIPKQMQTRIFRRFEIDVSGRNISGLGLGLYIVQQIVTAHGGTIQVDSEPGHGSTFTVELPRRIPQLGGLTKMRETSQPKKQAG